MLVVHLSGQSANQSFRKNCLPRQFFLDQTRAAAYGVFEMHWYTFPLIARREITPNTYECRFQVTDPTYQFEAGQYADFRIIAPRYPDAEHNIRTFSFVNAPQNSQELVIAWRYRNTGFKRNLLELPLHCDVAISKAIGFFSLPRQIDEPIIFIAGGIGIVPFMSLIQDHILTHKQHDITVITSNKSIQDSPYRVRLIDWHEKRAINLVETLTQTSSPHLHFGRISPKLLERVSNAQSSHYYLAGPPTMVDSLITQLIHIGIPDNRIHMEAFTGY